MNYKSITMEQTQIVLSKDKIYNLNKLLYCFGGYNENKYLNCLQK